MGTPAGAVRLFHSPGALPPLVETDPLPPHALDKTDTGEKAAVCKAVLVADILTELRAVAASLEVSTPRCLLQLPRLIGAQGAGCRCLSLPALLGFSCVSSILLNSEISCSAAVSFMGTDPQTGSRCPHALAPHRCGVCDLTRLPRLLGTLEKFLPWSPRVSCIIISRKWRRDRFDPKQVAKTPYSPLAGINK